MIESTLTTKSCLPRAKTRAGLSLLAYHGVALIIVLIFLSKSIDVAATVIPMLATSQILAATIWWSGSWIAPVLLDSPFQIRRWWLLVVLGSCQTFVALLVSHVVLKQQPLSSPTYDASSIAATIGFSLYGGFSSLVYVLLLRLSVSRKTLAVEPDKSIASDEI
ncbi:hypothetical protein HDF16_006113 [Granulicella aggregans]|uniref:Uncharacterized protein n=1 Tax=Granulicella aggregans TaxID=474949 RepID=A0A7W7ZKC5_9BACT|nr:hypothetical protein [Granulicella aggregans]